VTVTDSQTDAATETGKQMGDRGEEKRSQESRGEARVEGERKPIEISRSRLRFRKGEHVFE